MQSRGMISIGAWYRCSAGFTKEFPNWDVLHGIRIRHSTGSITGVHAADQVKTLSSNIGTPNNLRCENTWVHLEHTFDYTEGPAARAISMHIGYPLQISRRTTVDV